jgi:hypothetical protein
MQRRIYIKLLFTFVFMIAHITVTSQRVGYQWIRAIGNSPSIVSIIDKENNFIVATGDGDIMKLDIEGNLIWLISDTLFDARGIAVDNESNIYLTGTNAEYINQSQNTYTLNSFIYIAKYNKSGERIWVSKSITQTTEYALMGSLRSFSLSIACDLENSLYITGGFEGFISFDSLQLTDNNGGAIFISKYNTDGEAQWLKIAAGTNSNDQLTYGSGNEIICDQNEFIYVTGHFRGPFNFGGMNFPCQGTGDIFLTKIDSSGNFLNTMAIGGSEHDEGLKLIAEDNNIIVLAKFGGTISINGFQYEGILSNNNGIIINLVNDSIVWASQVGASNSAYNRDVDICFDGIQNVIYIGRESYSPYNTKIIRINDIGEIEWSYLMASSEEEYMPLGSSIVCDTLGGIYLAGWFKNNAYFGDSLLVFNDSKLHSFAGKIDTTKVYSGIYSNYKNNPSLIKVFPTITNGDLNIISNSINITGSVLYLFNESGQLAKQISINSNQFNINVRELSTGIYFGRIIGDNISQNFKIIKCK